LIYNKKQSTPKTPSTPAPQQN